MSEGYLCRKKREMKKLEVVSEKYLSTMVKMLVGLDKLDKEFEVLFLIEIVRESSGGYVVNDLGFRKMMHARLRIGSSYYDKVVSRLVLKGYLKRDGGLLYVHPKFMAVKESEGIFVISSK